jgi:hypothetical protein
MKKIDKGYMGFAEGMIFGMAQPKTNFRQVDWNKVKEFIEENKENLISVSAGLAEDWGWTSGEVWNNEKGYIPREDTYVYACSSWATPSIEVEYKDGEIDMFECWIEGNDPHSYFEF